jgi:hypothetical protein
VALPAFEQSSSVVWMENDHFVLVGLDTAWHGQFDLGNQQIDWLNRVVMGAGDRKIVLFSHHQPFSLFEKPSAKLAQQIGQVFHGKKQSVHAWYWGHEHRGVILDPMPAWNGTLLGRCVGHGGYPAFRDKFGDAPTETFHEVEAVVFRRRANPKLKASGLVLDGPNPYVVENPARYAPQGYLTLQLDGAKLTEQLLLPDGIAVYERQIA